MTAWEFFSYKMSALPTRWRRGSFAYKMTAFLGVYPQYGGVPTKWRHYPQDGSVLTRWRCYQQDGGFTHKMPTRWRQCRVSESFTHKIAAWESFPIKCRRYPQDGSVHTRWRRYQQDGGFTHKMPTRWRQCRVSASFTSEATHVTIKK